MLHSRSRKRQTKTLRRQQIQRAIDHRIGTRPHQQKHSLACQPLCGVALQKCDLVTREEFDIQTEVLAKTREKLEKLTLQITMLEEKLKNTP